MSARSCLHPGPSCCSQFLVSTERLELSRLAPPPPQDGVSTNFTTRAERTAERACGAVTPVGLEPTTRWLKASCSTN